MPASETWARLVVFCGGLLTAYGALVVTAAYLADTPSDLPFAAGLSSDQVYMSGWLMVASGLVGALSTCCTRRCMTCTHILLLLALNGCLRNVLRTQAKFDLDKCAQDATHDAIIQHTTYLEFFPGVVLEICDCEEHVRYVDARELNVCSNQVHRAWTWAAMLLAFLVSLFLGCSFAYCSTVPAEAIADADAECEQIKQVPELPEEEELPELAPKSVVYL